MLMTLLATQLRWQYNLLQTLLSSLKREYIKFIPLKQESIVQFCTLISISKQYNPTRTEGCYNFGHTCDPECVMKMRKKRANDD